jgi:predicted phage terminase large subunit-like protein
MHNLWEELATLRQLFSSARLSMSSELLRRLKELEDRQSCNQDLIAYASSIEVPDMPLNPDDEDGEGYTLVRRDMPLHHRLWYALLQAMVDGVLKAPDGTICRRVMALWPPGMAKSTTTAVVFPTWFMGRFPSKKVILTSYSDELPSQHGRNQRAICSSPQYKRIFDTELSDDTTAKDNYMLTNRSEYMGRGIHSGITGKRADLLVVDDAHKNDEEARSEVERNNTWGDYTRAARTRKKRDACEAIIGTRWHWDDLLGRILPDKYDGSTGYVFGKDMNWWYVLCCPMECERADDPLGRKPSDGVTHGDLLWPEGGPVKADMLPMLKSDSKLWNALYQQRPTAEEGVFFTASMFRDYDIPPAPDTVTILGMSDYAVEEDTRADFSVHIILGCTIGPDYLKRIYLLDLWRAQASTDKVINAQLALYQKWKPFLWLDPKELITKAIKPFRKQQMMDTSTYPLFKEYPNKGDKLARASSIAGYMGMNGLYVPTFAHWLADFKTELLSFPDGRHDDQVDALALMGRELPTLAWGRFFQTNTPSNNQRKVLSTNMRDCTVSLMDLFEDNEQRNKQLATHFRRIN